MDFAPSPRAQDLLQRMDAFIERYLLPHNAAWHAAVQAGQFPPPFLEDLKALAREEGLWNLFLPGLRDDEPGTRLSNLDYAPLAESMGRLPWAAEVFNCSAPDTGNIELLHLFASPEQRKEWLVPLLDGHIRSAFAMTEPDVASSDPTNLQTTVRREGDLLVVSGRKWFITGAAHPHCRLMIVMCRNADSGPGETGAQDGGAHRRHSMVLVPLDAPGVQVVRNIPVLHHHAPEGHCEILLQEVRIPQSALLGEWGGGFAMAQARLGPGRVHHCMRTIGQCELALQLAAERALERTMFGSYESGFANVQDWLAESRIEIDQARLLVLHTAWRLDQGDAAQAAQTRAQISAIKVVAARLQTRVVDRAMQVFGAMGLSPDTPLAQFWSWGRALHLMDGPDEVHLRTVARHELAQAKRRMGEGSAWFTTPEQMRAPPRVR